MAETLTVSKTASKEEKYKSLLPQIEALITGEDDFIANLSNIAAALKDTFDWLWVGFYIVKDGKQLVLGPFQGPVACTRINFGKGVCGASWKEAKTIIVPDVEQFPGHIACSSLSKSEIVVPLKDLYGNVTGVLDIDSDELKTFDEMDKKYLEKLVKFIM